MQSSLQSDFETFIQQNRLMNAVHRWSVHGVIVEWLTDHSGLEFMIQEMMRGFIPVDDMEDVPHVRIAIASGTQWSVPQDAEILPPSTNEFVDTLAAYDLRTTFARKGSINHYEIAPLAGATYEIDSGLALGYVQNAESFSAWKTTHLYLLIVFLEMLRGQNLFWIHAGTVATAGRGVLFIGETGQGKTTTVLSLVEAGFEFLSEDRTLLRVLPGSVEALAFPLDVAITPNSLVLIPSLRARIDEAPPQQRKMRINPSLLFPEAMIQQAAPALVLFPRVGNQKATSVERIGTSDALRRLLPNSLLASNPAVAERHFGALAQLIQSVRSYEITLGTEIEQIPRTIRKLLLTRI